MTRRHHTAFSTAAAHPAGDEVSLDSGNDAPSKTQRKNEMHSLQKLGEMLAALPPKELAELDLPERLRDALAETARIKKHEARRRHLQFIGKLMREVDPEPIRAWFFQKQMVPMQEKAQLARLENWRTRLLEETSALDDLCAQFPTINRAAWQKRIAAARNERLSPDKPPHHYRALFRDLKKLFIVDENFSESGQ